MYDDSFGEWSVSLWLVLLILFTTCLGVVEVVCVADVDKSVLVDNLVVVLITFPVLCTESGMNWMLVIHWERHMDEDKNNSQHKPWKEIS